MGIKAHGCGQERTQPWALDARSLNHSTNQQPSISLGCGLWSRWISTGSRSAV